MDPIFRVEHLTVGYQNPIISDASFDVNEGELVGIIGRNGQGKTTLLRGLTGDAKRFSGKIYVNEKDITKISVKQQAKMISVLPQKTNIPEGVTVEEILEMGCYASKPFFARINAKDKERIKHIAKVFHVAEFLEKECFKLSAGQQQMVLMCRMFIQNTPVMLLDEPNAALDYSNEQLLLDFLRRLVKEYKKVGILVIHDPEAALKWCDSLVIINDGKIAEKIDIKDSSKEQLQKALQILYPNIQVEKNPFCEGYICYLKEK
ncbi:ABC transporter ATP-binding protein [Faecalimonas sp.]